MSVLAASSSGAQGGSKRQLCKAASLLSAATRCVHCGPYLAEHAEGLH